MKRAAWWVAPILLFLLLYWPGLWIWFMQDDFAWLSLNLRWKEGHNLWSLLFQPSGHGTLRPLSERVFFLGFYQLFGLTALPFRVWIYATQIANLVLIAIITRRITGSRHAGFWAPVFWMANAAVAGTLSWICAYNQILCGFFILLAFYFLLKYIETERRYYYVLQWTAFLLGFGALEANLVYPMVAAAYCWCCARKHFWSTLPMFVVSGAYILANQLLVPKAVAGPYSMHFDVMMPVTLSRYWIWAFGGMQLDKLFGATAWLQATIVAACLLTIALLGFVVWKIWKREWLAGFMLLWFPLVLSPVVPLRDHFTDYYLTLPTIGIAMLGAWALAEAWKAGVAWKIAALFLAVAYLAPSASTTRHTVTWNLARSVAVREFVLGVGHAQELHPNKIILLSELPPDLFWSAMRDKPFPLVGAREVYLTPETEQTIPAHSELAVLTDFILPPAPMIKALAAGEAVVYEAKKPVLKNVTLLYGSRARWKWKGELARRVDVGNPLFADQLGDGWYPIEGGYRWMRGQAAVRLGGPRSAGEKLYITGYSSGEGLKQGPVELSLMMDGSKLGVVGLTKADAQFDASFVLPASLVGKDSVEMRLAISRTFISADGGRELGAAFGVFAVR